MHQVGRGTALTFLLLASTISAQVKTSIIPPSEPFSITTGSSFSASGGTETSNTAARSKITAQIAEAEEIIRQNHVAGQKIKFTDMTKSTLEGALRVLDPHSNFYDAIEWRELLNEQQSGYTGIGATIANFERGGKVETYVLSTFPGSPASRLGLRFGDRIVAINGEKMSERSSEEVSSKIRGVVGSAFKLTVERAATMRIETIEARRGLVAQPSIPDSYILRPGIGYIELSEGFNYTTIDEFDAAMSRLKRQGMTSLILDLRGNGGGIVDQAVKVAEQFLPAGTLVVSQRGRSRLDNRVWRSTNRSPETMPLVVLVDEDTASASEIVAGAFQDNDRALVIGEKTFGKGLVQSVIDLSSRTGLTLTTARYLTPSGRSIQRDYSQIDTYDYFRHKTPAAAIDKPLFAARTVTDRTVFGGDGITPDEIVGSPTTLTVTQNRLLDPIFFFVREVVSGRIAVPDNYRSSSFLFGQRIRSGDSVVTDDLVAAFTRFAKSERLALPAEAIKNEMAFVRQRLRFNLVMSAHGTISADQVLTEDDPQVAKAVELLPQAAQLAKLASEKRKQ